MQSNVIITDEKMLSSTILLLLVTVSVLSLSITNATPVTVQQGDHQVMA